MYPVMYQPALLFLYALLLAEAFYYSASARRQSQDSLWLKLVHINSSNSPLRKTFSSQQGED
uniref:Uncharacterized protein n=1 Tax=Picea sitchensis TaxID=3332 RepID=D5AC53_PICSI|nr:unknown [Picea sitchensis]